MENTLAKHFGGIVELGGQCAAGGISVDFDGVLLNAAELGNREKPQEIVERLYREHGMKCFDMLNGPFAIALHDSRDGQDTLVLVRDHHGQMGLCYRFVGGKVEYASDVKGGGTIDMKALGTYLSLGYIPAPMSIFKEWRKVPSGCAALFNIGGVKVERYWKPEPDESCTMSFKDVVEHSKSLVSKAIERCLSYDPEAGVLLSGGIDSNVVLWTMRGLLGKAPKSFTVGFPNDGYDERHLASISAKAAGSEHVTMQVEPSDYQNVKEILQSFEEPFADSSLLPDSVAMRLAAGNCKTVLTGDGGDELFGGYRRYRAMALRERLGEAPSRLIGRFLALAMRLLPRGGSPRGRLATARRMAHALSLPTIESYASFQELFSPSDVRRLMPRFAEAGGDYYDEWRRLFDECRSRGVVAKCNCIDMLGYLPDDGCVKERMAAFGTGLTVLSPLLDMDVTRFALSLPLSYRLDRREGKKVLRAIASENVPPELMHLVKRGFGMPLADWLRGPFSGLLNSCLSDKATWDVENLINADILSLLIMGHNSAAFDCASGLWAVNCLREGRVLS